MKQLIFLMITMLSLGCFGATEISGDYYTTDYQCDGRPVIQIKVNFELKTFKNSYIDSIYKEYNLTPPSDQVFSEKKSCYNPKNGGRFYCIAAKFESNTVTVNQHYEDPGYSGGQSSEDYIFSNDLTSFKLKIYEYMNKSYTCNYKMVTPRKASKNDLLLSSGALFKVSNKGEGFLSDPTGLLWTNVLRKNNEVVAVNYKEAVSYCESKAMRLPYSREVQILSYYIKNSSQIKVVGTNYLLEELFPEFSQSYYWMNVQAHDGGFAATYSPVEERSLFNEDWRHDPDNGVSIGVQCVSR